MNNIVDSNETEGIAGHGSFFQQTNLSGAEAAKATEWVRKHVDKRTVDLGERMDDIRDHMWELEKDGQIIVHRITDAHKPIEVQTLFGWTKKVPTMQLWHHKSCGQCGNIPGYPTSLLWFMNKFDFVPGKDYLDETDQTSRTAWNYHGSGHRQRRIPGRGVHAQLPPGLHLRQAAWLRSGSFLSASALRNLFW